MLQRVAIDGHSRAPSANLENFRPYVAGHLLDEITTRAKGLAGVRICHINSTSAGGGVAELLNSQLPLLQALGLSVEWRVIAGESAFYEATKGFHNALQGDRRDLPSQVWQLYLERNRESAASLQGEYDVYIVHDPQPAALRHYANGRQGKWIWRCHIDTSDPNPQVWGFLQPFIGEYNSSVFTMEQLIPPDLHMDRVALIPPAIDPLSNKNLALPPEISRQVVANAGLDLQRPILLQVSRFDPWKDPLGVIRAYRLVKDARPDVQLVLIGALAGDDPEGWSILRSVNEEAEQDPDLHVFTNLAGVGHLEVNAFQQVVDVVIQKSIREAFGLVVSEALWKGRAMVAGRTGGIPMQFPEDYQHYLVDGVEACATAILDLLDHPEARAGFGSAGRERVRQHFLMPRLIRDELALIQTVLDNGTAT